MVDLAGVTQEAYEKLFEGPPAGLRVHERKIIDDKICSIVRDALGFALRTATMPMQDKWLLFYVRKEGFNINLTPLDRLLQKNFKSVTYGELKNKYCVNFFDNARTRLWFNYIPDETCMRVIAENHSNYSRRGPDSRKEYLASLFNRYYAPAQDKAPQHFKNCAPLMAGHG